MTFETDSERRVGERRETAVDRVWAEVVVALLTCSLWRPRSWLEPWWLVASLVAWCERSTGAVARPELASCGGWQAGMGRMRPDGVVILAPPVE